MKNGLRKLALGFTGIVTLLVAWSFIEPHTLNLEEETAQIPNLPATWQGKKIGQVSDFQVGMKRGNAGTAERSIQVLIENEPDVVLISGDFVYHAMPNPEPQITAVIEIIRPLIDAGIPTYAVLGNHDYGMSEKNTPPMVELANNMETALEEIGVQVLENESTAIQVLDSSELDSDQELHLVAIGSRWANRADIDAALSEIENDTPRIALMHNPDSFEQFPANTAPLAVAGHTHGGQIRVPGLPQWSWLRLTQKDEVYADGWAKGYGKTGNNLYVNPGIGMSIAPVRLFCPPEVTIFTLENTQTASAP